MKDTMPETQPEWEKSTEYMLAKSNINILMGTIIDACFSRWNEKEMLIAQKIEDLVSNYVLDEMMKIYNERKFAKKQLTAFSEEVDRDVIGEEIDTSNYEHDSSELLRVFGKNELKYDQRQDLSELRKKWGLHATK